jgi:hypothetical protein
LLYFRHNFFAIVSEYETIDLIVTTLVKPHTKT